MTVAALLARSMALFAVGGLLMVLGTRGKSADVRRARATKFWGYFVIVHGVLAMCFAGPLAVTALAAGIVAMGAREARRAWQLMQPPRPYGLAIAVLAASAVFLAAAYRTPSPRVAWLYMVCASFDGLSQVFGQWLGRHPLAPRISPAKTIEGMVGGFIGSALVAQWLRDVADYSAARALTVAALIGLTSLVGDLCGSWAKRRAGLKDFSAVLPGQGGVVDRFNSFVASMALVGIWL